MALWVVAGVGRRGRIFGRPRFKRVYAIRRRRKGILFGTGSITHSLKCTRTTGTIHARYGKISILSAPVRGRCNAIMVRPAGFVDRSSMCELIVHSGLPRTRGFRS